MRKMLPPFYRKAASEGMESFHSLTRRREKKKKIKESREGKRRLLGGGGGVLKFKGNFDLL